MTTSCADRIKELRSKRAWSQEELATSSGVNVRTVQRLEGGKLASLDTLKALANAFDTDVANIVQPRPAAAAASDSILLVGIRTGRDLFQLVGCRPNQLGPENLELYCAMRPNCWPMGSAVDVLREATCIFLAHGR